MSLNICRICFAAIMTLAWLVQIQTSNVFAGVAPKSVSATKAEISLVDGVAVDKNGDVYIAMRNHNVISRIDSNGRMTRYAGSGESGYSGDGGPALSARLRVPANLEFDNDGNLYIADRENHRVRKVDANGIITTVAGNGKAGYSGDGGPADQASLNLPSGLAVDSKGNLYIADRSNDRIRKVSKDGVISTYAGDGTEGWSGDAGPATKARINKPFGITFDNKDNLYIADRGNNRVRKVSNKGIITTIVGDGGFFFMGDNGPAYRASIAHPTDVAADDNGNLYIADRDNNRIRIMDAQGMIRTIAGTGQRDYNGDSELARETNLHLPFGVEMQKDGKLLIIDRSNYRIRRVDPKNGKVETIAGNGKKLFGGDGGPATGARVNFPHGMVVDENDNLIFSDKGHFRIRKITPKGVISTIAGDGVRGNVGNNVPALKANLYGVASMIISPKKEIVFISPSGFVSVIRKIDTKGYIHDIIDTGGEDYLKSIKSERHGRSITSKIEAISQFSDLAYDSKNNLYIADRINHQIRLLTPQGKISVFAGTGDSDYYGDGGPADQAAFRDPAAIAMDKDDNLYIADAANNRIRKIDAKGVISTVAGNGTHKDTGDGGSALSAGIRSMDDLVFSPAGELHIVESNTHRIRKISKDGIVSTVAGNGYTGFYGDGGPATKAMLKNPAAISFDSKGNMFISDMGNNRVRKVDSNGVITTYAGTGVIGWGQDGETVEIIVQNFP